MPADPTRQISTASSAAARLRELLELFGDEGDLERFVPVRAGDVPEPYNRLLVHDQHMTVTLEARFGGPLDLEAHAVRRAGDDYARKITLRASPGGPTVLLGVMRFDLACCPAPLREAVLSARVPLGRILTEHDVLRTLRPGPYYRVAPGNGRLLALPVRVPTDCHARLARIECGGARAVEVLEIVVAA